MPTKGEVDSRLLCLVSQAVIHTMDLPFKGKCGKACILQASAAAAAAAAAQVVGCAHSLNQS